MGMENENRGRNGYDVLSERGFIQQVTDAEAVKELLQKDKITCYVGFDPTADSLHVGSLLPIMAASHLQRAGHQVLVIVGDGTAMVGDPSGKTEMRQMLSLEAITANLKKIESILTKYIDFSGDRALILNNYQWLGKLNYIDFLRDIGRHFSVNRMLAAEAYKLRLETGLSFIEFNYQLLQAYDFLTLFKNYHCQLQFGGDDQWGNILAGVDLIRRIDGETVQAFTIPLLTTATGEKMGKTAKGAVWLDGEKLSPYDFYQFWINTDDRDVARFLAYFTYLPMAEVTQVRDLSGADLNAAKAVLAYEATRISHGVEAAQQALQAAAGVFGARSIPDQLLPSSTIPRGQQVPDNSDVPSTMIEAGRFREGYWIVALLADLGLAGSRGEARRLIQQGGVYANDRRVDSDSWQVRNEDFNKNSMLIRIGKKRYHRIVLGNEKS